MKFKHGDRVCFSAAPALGTVIISERGNRVSDDCVRVQWDGKKRRETFHESLLKAADAESESKKPYAGGNTEGASESKETRG